LSRSWPVKLALGLLIAGLVLGLAELALHLSAELSQRDWRADPLPQQQPFPVLCPKGQLRILCPEPVHGYERVRPELFFDVPDRSRVAVVGESFVFGYGLAKEQAWPAQLQALLGDGVEVLNMGRCGAYSSVLVPVAEAALQAGADAVVLAVGNNEHTMTSFYAGWAGRHPLLVYSLSEALSGSQLYGLLFQSLAADLRPIESFVEAPLRFENELDQAVYAARRRPPNLDRFRDGLADPEVTRILEQEQRLKERIFEDRLDEMIRRVQDAGAQPILATLPRDLTAPPVLSGIHEGDPQQVREVLKTLLDPGQGSPPDIQAALALDERVAAFHYHHGMGLLERGEREQAAEALRLASEWEMIPDATPSINRIIREAARSHGCPLADLDRMADTHMGRDDGFWLDRLHVDAQGARIVAEELAPLLRQVLKEGP